MRVSFRLIFSLIAGVTPVTFLFARSEVRGEKRGLRSDLERRAEVLAESLEEAIEPLMENNFRTRRQQIHLQQIVDRFDNRERLAGVAVYDNQGRPLAVTSKLSKELAPNSVAVKTAIAENRRLGEFVRLGPATIHVYVVPLHQEAGVTGALAIVHDASYIEAQSLAIWRQAVWRVLVQVVFITLVTLLIVRWSIVGPIARTAEWLRDLR